MFKKRPKHHRWEVASVGRTDTRVGVGGTDLGFILVPLVMSQRADFQNCFNTNLLLLVQQAKEIKVDVSHLSFK